MCVCVLWAEEEEGLGSHGWQKAKPVGFIFLHTFQLIWMNFGVVV